MYLSKKMTKLFEIIIIPILVIGCGLCAITSCALASTFGFILFIIYILLLILIIVLIHKLNLYF